MEGEWMGDGEVGLARAFVPPPFCMMLIHFA